MKKLLLMVGGIFISINAFANTISIPNFISNNDVTIASLENQRSTIVNAINGGIAGGGVNITAGSIASQDESIAISIVQFRSEAFNNFTYSGMLPATSANLTSTISAGVSYISGARVQTGATNHGYTASKDTYTYINSGGFFDYQEVANNAAAPSTPTNDLLLAKVVTSGSAVTTVTDLRTTSIQITVNNSNFANDYRDQSYVSRDTATNFHVAPGQFSLGTSNYNNTANTTTRSIVTGANWIENGYPSGYVGNVFVYGYNTAGTAFDFKFSSSDVVNSDTASNSAGVLRYLTTGNIMYRALGWAFLSADTVQLYQTSNFRDVGTKNIVSRTDTTQVTTTSTSLVNDNFSDVKFYSSGGFVTINYNLGMDDTTVIVESAGIAIDSSDIASTLRTTIADGTTTGVYGVACTWSGVLGRGIHTIQGRFKVASGTGNINARTMTVSED